jgi:Leucine-rich repeat (LRR) protein
MNSICDYCKANLQGIEFQARVRPKGNFNELLKEHGGSIKAVREVLTHHIDSRCTCDELHLKLQCALNQNNNDGPKNELDATLQQILNAYKNRDCNKESLLYLLRNTRVATDVHHCRDTLWKLSDVDLSQCQMCLLPASFGNILIGVRKLNLEMNNLHEIPTSLTSCLHLEHLNLSRNRFTFLPSWLSNFKKLKHLNVGFNSFASILLQEAHSSVITATITKGVEKGNDDSKDWIEYVDYEQNRIVYFNKRSGEVNTKLKSRSKSNGYIQHTSKQSVPNTECTESINLPLQKVEVKEMVTLSNLRELKLNNNKFTSLPISVSHMTSLTVLKIQKNEITSLPSDLGNLVKLRVFDVSGNKLTTIPDLRNCIHLEEVDISSNYIDKFPDCILAMKNLQTLNISYNCIDRIPYKLGFHETLSTLNVYNNPIADPPYELLINNTNQALWECRELHLKQQQGDIPTIPIHNSGIRSERLALDPEFDAEIYQKIEEANLKSLNLELQNLNLSLIPYRVYTSKRIKGIHLQGNPLCTLDWKESSRNLMSLNLSDCKLKDISGSIKLLSNLERLHLEGNSLTLLPKEIVQLGRLKYLFLNNNALVEMPTELEGLSSLVELHLNHNCLKRLPESIHLLTDLEVICSSHNKLQSISSSITSMSKLKKLNLRQNNLKQIPKLGTLSLSHLLLSHNEIKRLDPDFFLPNLKKTL